MQTNRFEEIKAILGEPTKTFDNRLKKQRSHWWIDRLAEEFEQVKDLDVEKCPVANSLIQRGRFDINYVENRR